MDNLSEDLLLIIFLFCQYDDIMTLNLICKKFYNYLNTFIFLSLLLNKYKNNIYDKCFILKKLITKYPNYSKKFDLNKISIKNNIINFINLKYFENIHWKNILNEKNVYSRGYDKNMKYYYCFFNYNNYSIILYSYSKGYKHMFNARSMNLLECIDKMINCDGAYTFIYFGAEKIKEQKTLYI